MSEHGERALWAAVMELAWQDATGEVVTSEKEPVELLKARARRWFERAEGTFPDCCQALGLDIAAVQERYRAAIEAQEGTADAQGEAAGYVAAQRATRPASGQHRRSQA